MVLNSLTGAGFIEQSLVALAQGGCLLEIGNRNIWSAEQMRTARPDVQYHIINMPDDSATLRRMLTMLLAQMHTGELQPLPYTAFPIQRVGEAFQFMQQARHIGKIVVTQPVPPLHADGTYLITGGLGGLGLATAQRFVAEGAEHLVLVGRSQPTPSAEPHLEALRAAGANITIAQADVANADQMTAIINAIDPAYPLRGIIHAAGVVDDGLLATLNWAQFRRVLAPKLDGAMILHKLTESLPLDFFVLFSSMAGVLGSAGQANYTAANATLDALAHHRRANGLPALTINWGGWSEIGMAATLDASNRGLRSIAPAHGLDILMYLLQQDAAQVGVLPIDWQTFFDSTPAAREMALLENYVTTSPAPPSGGLSLETLAPEKRQTALMQHLRAVIADVLGLEPGQQIDPQQGLLDLGLDSLMAVEVRNRLSRDLGVQLPSTLVLDYPSLAVLAPHLLSLIFPDAPQSDPDLDALSETELVDLLAQELKSLKDTQ